MLLGEALLKLMAYPLQPEMVLLVTVALMTGETSALKSIPVVHLEVGDGLSMTLSVMVGLPELGRSRSFRCCGGGSRRWWGCPHRPGWRCRPPGSCCRRIRCFLWWSSRYSISYGASEVVLEVAAGYGVRALLDTKGEHKRGSARSSRRSRSGCWLWSRPSGRCSGRPCASPRPRGSSPSRRCWYRPRRSRPLRR